MPVVCLWTPIERTFVSFTGVNRRLIRSIRQTVHARRCIPTVNIYIELFIFCRCMAREWRSLRTHMCINWDQMLKRLMEILKKPWEICRRRYFSADACNWWWLSDTWRCYTAILINLWCCRRIFDNQKIQTFGEELESIYYI